MEITEVRVRLIQDDDKEKLRAFATITFDNCFVVREVKVIQGDKGYFVAMPSRKAMERCRNCGVRNVVKAMYCSRCGQRLPQHAAPPTPAAREKIYLDIAHPINAECRKMIHNAVIGCYEDERQKLNESQEEKTAAVNPAPTQPTPALALENPPPDAGDTIPEADNKQEVIEAAGEQELIEAEGGQEVGSDDDFDKGIFA